MRAEFLKDDDGKIWFSWAKDIFVRSMKSNKDKYEMREVKQLTTQYQRQIINEIDKHKQNAGERASTNIQKMHDLMNQHYEQVKEEIGIMDALNDSDHNEQSDQVFAKLRPSSPYKFKELLY